MNRLNSSDMYQIFFGELLFTCLRPLKVIDAYDKNFLNTGPPKSAHQTVLLREIMAILRVTLMTALILRVFEQLLKNGVKKAIGRIETILRAKM